MTDTVEYLKIISDLRKQNQELTERCNYYRELVVWGHFEQETPSFYQGSQGEHEINEPVSAGMVNTLVRGFETYKRERERYRHSAPEITGEFFLAGGSGERDSNYLPQYVRIVPAYGCAWEQLYERTDKTISYEGT